MARKKSVVTEEAVEIIETTEVNERASYVALVSFYDKGGKIIRKGDVYESEDDEWIAYLKSNKNKTGKPVIE